MAQIGLRTKSSPFPILFAAMGGAAKGKLRIPEYPWEVPARRFPSLWDTRRGSACKTLFTSSFAVHVCCLGVRKKASFSQVPQEKLTLRAEESSKGEIFSAH